MARIARLPSISVLPSLIPALILAPLFLAACSPHAPSAPPASPSTPASTGAAPGTGAQTATASPETPSPESASKTPLAHATKIDTDTYSFEYGWPAAPDAVPPLRAWLAADEASARRHLVAESASAKADAARGEYPFHPLGRWQEWQVLADTPGWLSLTALIGIDSGGAHPNYVYAATLWDKAAGQRRKTIDLFTAPAALATAIHTPFCAELQAQRAHKRGGQASLSQPSMDMSEFDTCPDPLAQTLALRADSSAGFDHLVVLIAPYEAGPYAEGTYEIALPVTPALLASVKPQWRNSFTPIRKSGG